LPFKDDDQPKEATIQGQQPSENGYQPETVTFDEGLSSKTTTIPGQLLSKDSTNQRKLPS
jgi:hypothetical protein